ncbi:hypothetical protein MVEN_00192100 [Mycena venus]|uniref:DNA breaking-rejoining enzyme n=1 Tax=Mycena venus TaxID=2733690 RepID=A0A8H6YY86_9AGAR|nr:hypothetical protein MVEN_00192100 [Mycena venus]
MRRGFARPPDILPPPPPRRPSSSQQLLQPAPPVPYIPSSSNKPKPRKPKAGNEILNNNFHPHVLAQDRLRLWSSPFSRDHDAEFRKHLPQDAVDKTYAALFGALAPDTQENYTAGLLRFHQFCDKFEISERAQMPASHFLLAAFIAQYVGTPGTTLTAPPWEGEDRWVELARRTANKEGTAFRREQRGPVTIEHMIALHASLDLSKPFNAAIWALATAAFWGCRRLGELTVPSLDKFDPKYHVTRGMRRRRISPQTARPRPLPFPSLGLNRHATAAASLTLTDRDDDLCPEKALQNHLVVNKGVPLDAPLFAFTSNEGNWSPMTKDWFMRRCTGIWKAANLLLVLRHSFRIGGSTELLLAGVPCEVVAALGGWTSLAFLLYWRKIEHIIPMNIGKAYDKAKLAEVAKAFEEFRITHNIALPTADLVL